MDEADLIAELFEEFTTVYDADNVQSDYRLSTDSRPDIAVFDEDDNPLLIAEAKTHSNKKSQWKAFDRLRHYQSQANPPFLGFLTGDINYIYKEYNVDGFKLQISSGTPPQSPADLEDRRGFKTNTELRFCYEQSNRLCKEELGEEISIADFLRETQRIAIAEEHQQEITAWEQRFIQQIDEIDQNIREKYPFYNSASENSLDQSRIIQGVLNGYSIRQTDDTVISEFVAQIPSLLKDQSSHGTPIPSAKYISEQLDISSDDRILDPAMGWGNILREIAQANPEADSQGIELNQKIAQTASSLNTLTKSDISIKVADGIKTAWRDDSFHSEFDHVVLDPPIGLKLSEEELIEELSNWENANIEDVFLDSSLNYLKEDGLLTAIVPLGILSRNHSARLRDKLKKEYCIESIIEVENGSFYDSVRSDLAVIQIRNREPEVSDTTEFLVLDRLKDSNIENFEPDIQQRLELPVSEIPDKVLIPSKVISQQEVHSRLNEIYSDFVSLNSISSGFRRGVRLSSEQVTPEGDIQYLKISDVTGESESRRFIDENEIEDAATAGPTDLLISAAGTIDIAYVPEREVVPHSNWVVVRFESESLARAFQGFFNTPVGGDLLNSLATGTTIPHLSISVLNDIQVPDFRNHNSVDEVVSELAKIEQLNQGRVNHNIAVRIEELLREGM
ncbi:MULTISPECIES: N-6 DNA methylase [Halorussus]|uniref:N-6 DNA methylase n=1 Tax=Halorussus TaxID=1070314 RepID=UPI00209FAB6D|nr:N-6 DNA methylase [Halorussus vallis]USZ77580.1 N-6 DNA methylase [Halorussus vallis]